MYICNTNIKYLTLVLLTLPLCSFQEFLSFINSLKSFLLYVFLNIRTFSCLASVPYKKHEFCSSAVHHIIGYHNKNYQYALSSKLINFHFNLLVFVFVPKLNLVLTTHLKPPQLKSLNKQLTVNKSACNWIWSGLNCVAMVARQRKM